MASIEKRVNRASVSWRVIWYQDGERQYETLADDVEAAKFKQLVEGSGNRWPHGWTKGVGYGAEATGPTFEEWAEKAIARRSRASERAKEDYRRDLRTYAFPLFGRRPVGALMIEDSDALVEGMLALGRSPKTISNVHGLVSSIVKDAMKARPPLIDWNPFEGRLGELPDVRVEEMVFLTPDEFARIQPHVPEYYRTLATVLIGLGPRFGEATALQVRDLTLTGPRPSLSIVRAWKRRPDGTYYLGEPKTRNARRTLNLSPLLVDLLAEQVRGKKPGDLVFPGRAGGQMLNATFHEIAWGPAVAWASVCGQHGEAQQKPGRPLRRRSLPEPCDCTGTLTKLPRVHDLRHSYASWLIADGLPLSLISRRMGHASITTTDHRYGHLLPELDGRVNEAIDGRLQRPA